jgi:hypothetical protein
MKGESEKIVILSVAKDLLLLHSESFAALRIRMNENTEKKRPGG